MNRVTSAIAGENTLANEESGVSPYQKLLPGTNFIMRIIETPKKEMAHIKANILLSRGIS